MLVITMLRKKGKKGQEAPDSDMLILLLASGGTAGEGRETELHAFVRLTPILNNKMVESAHKLLFTNYTTLPRSFPQAVEGR